MNKRERQLAESTMAQLLDEHGTGFVSEVCGVARPTVYQWQICPPHHVLTLEAATGVPRSFLRPDLYPGKMFTLNVKGGGDE